MHTLAVIPGGFLSLLIMPRFFFLVSITLSKGEKNKKKKRKKQKEKAVHGYDVSLRLHRTPSLAGKGRYVPCQEPNEAVSSDRFVSP